MTVSVRRSCTVLPFGRGSNTCRVIVAGLTVAFLCDLLISAAAIVTAVHGGDAGHKPFNHEDTAFLALSIVASILSFGANLAGAKRMLWLAKRVTKGIQASASPARHQTGSAASRATAQLATAHIDNSADTCASLPYPHRTVLSNTSWTTCMLIVLPQESSCAKCLTMRLHSCLGNCVVQCRVETRASSAELCGLK